MKRSLVLSGLKTSISLEDAFWQCLKEISSSHSMTVAALVSEIDRGRNHVNRSSAIRLYVLGYYRDRCVAATAPNDSTATARHDALPPGSLLNDEVAEPAPPLEQ
jgi:predicted DNA-binding ribbon-helix-helix protein